MKNNWVSLLGEIKLRDNTLIFKGKTVEQTTPAGEKISTPSLGNILSDESFQEGSISTEIEFDEITEESSCQIMLSLDLQKSEYICAGISRDMQPFSIRHFTSGAWVYKALSGDRANLEAKRKYKLELTLKGSLLTLKIDEVEVLAHTFTFNIPRTKVGLWLLSKSDVKISNFKVTGVKSKVFVVMQFSEPYNDIYKKIIKPVCENEFKYECVRSDEIYQPGIIIADIINQIKEAKIIIAEISSNNPNVYYEVGYSHALDKPTILLAQKETKLPFDVSSFRTLYYENSIVGKEAIEEGIRKHLYSINNS